MAWSAKVVCDSVAPNGRRAISIEATYPRFIHSEVLTHRDRGRNSSSSRAIPWPAMCSRISNDPVIPLEWVREQKGMSGGPALTGEEAEKATAIWLKLRDNAVYGAQQLADLGIHKSLCNRVTEPWMWITTIMTATQWKHFFRLRAHPEAEQHFQKLARMMIEAIAQSKPKKLGTGHWHLPYVDDQDLHQSMYDMDLSKVNEHTRLLIRKSPIEMFKMASVARCARVSIISPGEAKRSLQKDMETFNRLYVGSKLIEKDKEDQFDSLPHISPFEHVLEAMGPTVTEGERWSGCVRGFKQYRKEFANEYIDTDYPEELRVTLAQLD